MERRGDEVPDRITGAGHPRACGRGGRQDPRAVRNWSLAGPAELRFAAQPVRAPVPRVEVQREEFAQARIARGRADQSNQIRSHRDHSCTSHRWRRNAKTTSASRSSSPRKSMVVPVAANEPALPGRAGSRANWQRYHPRRSKCLIRCERRVTGFGRPAIAPRSRAARALVRRGPAWAFRDQVGSAAKMEQPKL